MNTVPRPLPRFLPTLTEVVKPSAPPQATSLVQPDFEALTQTLTRRVDALVQTRVQQELERMIRAVAAEQSVILSDHLKTDLHHEIKRMVADAARDWNKANKFNS